MPGSCRDRRGSPRPDGRNRPACRWRPASRRSCGRHGRTCPCRSRSRGPSRRRSPRTARAKASPSPSRSASPSGGEAGASRSRWCAGARGDARILDRRARAHESRLSMPAPAVNTRREAAGLPAVNHARFTSVNHVRAQRVPGRSSVRRCSLRAARRQLGAVLLLAAVPGKRGARASPSSSPLRRRSAPLACVPAPRPRRRVRPSAAAIPVVGQPVRPARARADAPPAASRTSRQRATSRRAARPGHALAGRQAGPAAAAARPAVRRRPRLEDPQAFDPLGVRVGAMTLRPAIEVSGPATTPTPTASRNPAAGSLAAQDRRRACWRTADWERHALSAVAARHALSLLRNARCRPAEVDGALRLRLDALRDTTIDLGGASAVSRRSSPASSSRSSGASRGQIARGRPRRRRHTALRRRLARAQGRRRPPGLRADSARQRPVAQPVATAT